MLSNESYGPIPSGATSVPQVVTQILMLLGVVLPLGYDLDIRACDEFFLP